MISASEDASSPVPSTAEHVIKIVSPVILLCNILIIFSRHNKPTFNTKQDSSLPAETWIAEYLLHTCTMDLNCVFLSKYSSLEYNFGSVRFFFPKTPSLSTNACTDSFQEPLSNGPLFCELHFYQRVSKPDMSKCDLQLPCFHFIYMYMQFIAVSLYRKVKCFSNADYCTCIMNICHVILTFSFSNFINDLWIYYWQIGAIFSSKFKNLNRFCFVIHIFLPQGRIQCLHIV